MHQIIYVSAATHLFSDQELLDLLSHSRESNQRCGVTGMLLYKEGDFMQVIEGEQDVIRRLFERISLSKRHSMVTVLADAPVQERAFADWSMGFRNLSPQDVSQTPGFTDFLNRRLIESRPSEAKLAHRILSTFSRT